MPAKLLRCVRSVKKDLADDHSDWSSKRVDRVARAICVKRTGQRFKHTDPSLDNMFGASFTESGKARNIHFAFESHFDVVEKDEIDKVKLGYQIRDPESVLSVGRAAIAGTSLNFNLYEADELRKATPTLPGVTCQVDHSESARDTFGIVTDGWWDKTSDPPEMAYIAELEGSDPITAKVRKGYLKGVSMAGGARQVICTICNEEWDWLHEHTPGEKYDGKTCERKFKGIFFRHLGFTAFPAVEGADVNYVAASMSEALENALAFMDHQEARGTPNIDKNGTRSDNSETTFGEMIMSSDQVTEYLKEIEREKFKSAQLAQEKEELEAKLSETDTLKKELELLQEREQKRLVSEIIDLQVQLKKLDPKKAEERRAELANESTAVLEAKVSVLKEFEVPVSAAEPALAGSKSVMFASNSRFKELDAEKQEHYINEAKLHRMSEQMFGHPPSVSAVKTLEEWDYNMDRWKTDFSDLIKSVPRQKA